MNRFSAAAALSLSAVASQAPADVTPEQVWENFQAYIMRFGSAEMTATTSRDGADLNVTGIIYNAVFPEDDSALMVTMPDMVLTDDGDGTVTISYSAVSDIVLSVTEVGLTDSFALTMTQDGFTVSVEGAPGNVTYAPTAQSVEFALTGMSTGGEVLSPEEFSMSMATGSVSGDMTVVQADGRFVLTYDVALASLAYEMGFDDPSFGDSGTFAGEYLNVVSSGVTDILEGGDYAEAVDAFLYDGEMTTVLSHEGGQTSFDLIDSLGVTTGRLASSGMSLRAEASPLSTGFSFEVVDQSVMLSFPDFPLPLDLTLEKANFGMQIPLDPSTEPEDAAMSIALDSFAMGDALWNLFDPGQVLSRAPANVAMVLDARVTPFVNLLDNAALQEVLFAGQMPAEVNSLTLSTLLVEAAGAALLGEGSFTFDNSDMMTIPGVPRPEGQLDLTIIGANGLIDNLIALGLLPAEDAMGMRMMLGMFTVLGDGPDTATSKIEINAEGHILANGQRIQ